MKKTFWGVIVLCLITFAIVLSVLAGCEVKYICESKAIQNGNYTLDGELVLPKTGNNFPAVVIVSGSGAMDMDGSIGSQKPYKDLSYKLAERGIASIRFNKVTYQYADSVSKDVNFSLDDEYFYAVDDCIKILKEDERVNNSAIYLLGHSLGAQIIPLFLQNDTTLAGGIIMAGTTMHVLDLLLEQVARQSQSLYEEYLPYANYAKSLQTVPTGEENRYYFGAYTAYHVSYNAIDRFAVVELDCPLLVMQGELDLQVTTEHFETYKQLLGNKSDVVFKLYQNLNHIFSNGIGETVATAYSRHGTIDDEVIDDIVSFVLK